MCTIRRLRPVAFAAAVLASIGSAALAQTRAAAADLGGRVFDQSNAVVPGAIVIATNLATGVERSAVSQRDGRYSIPAKTPYAHHASAGIGHELGRGFVVSASGVFVRGFNQVGNIEYNPVTSKPNTGSRPLDVNGERNTSGMWRQYTAWGESWYRGLTLSIERRFQGRYQLLASYTWSRAEDLMADFAFQQPQDVGSGRDPNNPNGLPLGFDPYAERGPSLQDQRHRFVLSGMYTMPRGITVSTIVTVGSGRPFNILAGSDLNRNGDGGTGPADRPRTNTADPATSIARNAGLLPRTSTVDVRVAKQSSLGGRARLDLMLEMFNLFNTTNYTQVDNICGDTWPCTKSTFGQFTEAGPPFQAQLGAKVSF